MKKKHVYLWVIKSKQKNGRGIWGAPAWLYFAERTAIKNPQFVTSVRWKRKYFASKNEAEKYYFKKSRTGIDVSSYTVQRKKLFLDKDGCIGFFENRN